MLLALLARRILMLGAFFWLLGLGGPFVGDPFMGSPGSRLHAQGMLDCNSNGVPDSTDIASGTSTDCNANGVPDDCEGSGTLGWIAHEHEIGDLLGGFTVDLETFDRFGGALAVVGDLDGNGVPDLAVGAYGDDDGGPDQGAVYILFLTSTGSVQSHVKIAEGVGGFTGPLAASDRFGRSVVAVGDLNQDGTIDIAVGAPGDDDGGNQQGAVWILFLGPGGTVVQSQKISATQGGFTGTLSAFDFFGESLAAIGDLDSSGTPDLVVGARGSDGNGVDRGAVWVLFLAPGGTVLSSVRIGEGSGGFTGQLDDEDGFGSAVASLSDLDGDGRPELFVGAPLDDDGGADTGAVWRMSLQTSGLVAGVAKWSLGSPGLPLIAPGEGWGAALAAAGDLNDDGTPDLLIGAPRGDDGGVGIHANRGAVHVLMLTPAITVLHHRKISDTEGGFEGTLIDASSFGAAVAAVGDVDGDGRIELAVGAVGDHPTTGFGSLWILFPAPGPADCNGNGLADSCDIANGTSLDLNGDGIPDECGLPSVLWVRGDCNADGGINLADAIYLLNGLFPSGTPPPAPPCEDACDANDSGGLNLADAIFLLGALFGQPATPLPPPHPTCGPDPTDTDPLGCTAFPPCP